MKNSKKIYDEIGKFGLIFIPINWAICAVVTTVLWLAIDSTWGLGYLLGSMTSFLTFGLHMKNARLLGTEKNNAYMSAVTGVGIRLFISAMMLLAAYFIEDFNIIATFIGLVVIKVVLIVFTLTYDLIVEKKTEKTDDLSAEAESTEVEGGDEISS